MKNLSSKIQEINELIKVNSLQSVSFDIDGTVYPILAAEWRWWKHFFHSPREASAFLKIRKKWEKRRKGIKQVEINTEDIFFFENFLKNLLDPTLIPPEIREWIKELNEQKIKVFFLSDHGAAIKLKALELVGSGAPINCLVETGELKPHQKIAELLLNSYGVNAKTHLHLGDRWTDEKQAKLIGSHFRYLKP